MTDIYRGTGLTVNVHHAVKYIHIHIYDINNGVSAVEFPLSQVGLQRFLNWAMQVE